MRFNTWNELNIEHAWPEDLIYFRLCNHGTVEIEAETHPGYFAKIKFGQNSGDRIVSILYLFAIE